MVFDGVPGGVRWSYFMLMLMFFRWSYIPFILVIFPGGVMVVLFYASYISRWCYGGLDNISS